MAKDEHSEPDLLSEAALARRWDCCQETVARLRKRGGLPYVAMPGVRRPLIRYVVADVEAWLAGHRRGEVPATEPEPEPTPKRHNGGRPRRQVAP